MSNTLEVHGIEHGIDEDGLEYRDREYIECLAKAYPNPIGLKSKV